MSNVKAETRGPVEQLMRDMEKEINRLRDVQAELLGALECSETVMILLKDEVEGLGCNGRKVLPKVQAAIMKARQL
jgi:hypothetical protein